MSESFIIIDLSRLLLHPFIKKEISLKMSESFIINRVCFMLLLFLLQKNEKVLMTRTLTTIKISLIFFIKWGRLTDCKDRPLSIYKKFSFWFGQKPLKNALFFCYNFLKVCHFVIVGNFWRLLREISLFFS